ncbi:MAG: hypothetical protein ACYCUG_00690 [Acidimicrobiales bacterium]
MSTGETVDAGGLIRQLPGPSDVMLLVGSSEIAHWCSSTDWTPVACASSTVIASFAAVLAEIVRRHLVWSPFTV